MAEPAMSATELRLRVVPAIAEIAPAEWDAWANPSGRIAPEAGRETELNSQDLEYNPFISHAFLDALETSGSATARSGWQPQHLVAETAEGQVLGVLPCYLKSHSRGEYVFDHGWADAYERAGGRYYPKLQVSVPFTPVPGRRLLAAPGLETIQPALASGLVELCRLRDASSVHVTFATQAEWLLLGQHGFLRRTDQQYHWFNASYGSFEDFLRALTARKRKFIRREPRDAPPPGTRVLWLP